MADLSDKGIADAEAKYLGDPDVCPFCSGQIIADEMTGDGACQHQETHCESCDATFMETYRLERVGLLSGPAGRIENSKEVIA